MPYKIILTASELTVALNTVDIAIENAKEHIKTPDPRRRDQKVSETLEILKRIQTQFEKAEGIK